MRASATSSLLIASLAVLTSGEVAAAGVSGPPVACETAPLAAAQHMISSREEKQQEAEAEAEADAQLKLSIVVGIFGLGSTFAIGHILEMNHVHWVPEAAVGVILGWLISTTMLMLGDTGVLKFQRFDFEFFMMYLLPPIIFEAGYNMNVHSFIANLGPTMFFAFVGTFLSTFIVGGLVWYAGQLGLCYPMGLLASLTFGSLISATDPVTVLAVFQALGVKADLFSMVFGESVLNDAVAIVLSRTLLSFLLVPVSAATVANAALSFVIIFGGSMLIGAIYGGFSSLAFKYLKLSHHDTEGQQIDNKFVELGIAFCFPWSGYFTAEALQLSGIVAILSCGMVMASFTRHVMSPEAVDLTSNAIKGIATIAESFVFVYLGMALITFPIFRSTTWILLAVSMLACFVGRLHIYLGGWLANCCRPQESKISQSYMFVMWFAGLRGGVAFALASMSYLRQDFPQRCGGLPEDSECPYSEDVNDSTAMLQLTMLIAVFTILVFGGAITKVAITLNVVEEKKPPSSPSAAGGLDVSDASPAVKAVFGKFLSVLTHSEMDNSSGHVRLSTKASKMRRMSAPVMSMAAKARRARATSVAPSSPLYQC